MEYSSTQDGTNCVFNFNGKFTFSDNDTVRKLIGEARDGGYTQCAIDLSGLESIDSAGLGMLLLLNDNFQDMGKSLELRGASGQVQKMLEISKFSDVLNIKA